MELWRVLVSCLSPLIDRRIAYESVNPSKGRKEAFTQAYLHVWVVAGKVRCLTFVAAEFSLYFLFLSGPSYGDGQGLKYDSHAPGVR